MCISFSVQFDPKSIHVSKHGSITGVLFWKLDKYCFPDLLWNDFVVVISCWWLSAYSKIKLKGDCEYFRWMDGPYYGTVCLLDDSLLNITLYDDHDGSITCEKKVDRDKFYDSLMSSALSVYESCKHIDNKDVLLLRSLLGG